MSVRKRIEDDEVSFCGSISGETFSSRRRRNTCSLRQHSVEADILAQKLRELPAGYEKQDAGKKKEKQRFNSSFHHFRFVVVMFGGFSLGSMFLLRYNITVAILKMVNQTALYEREHPNKTMDDFLAEGHRPGGEFNWDNEIQQMIMSWYMIAYTLPQVPCTKLGIMIGSRRAMPISLFICALATLLTPISAYYGWQWVIGLRLINGIGASAMLPMMLNLVESWMPYDEIQLGLTCAQMLQAILTAANPLVCGYLSAIHWSYAFYLPGIVTLIFCVIFSILVTDRPDENWFISQRELDLICDCSSDETNKSTDHQAHEEKRTQMKPVSEGSEKEMPEIEFEKDDKAVWYDVFQIPSFYFYIIMWCFYCSSISAFTFTLPTYLRQFLKIPVARNGIFCCIIQAGSLFATFWPHPFVRIMQTNFGFSLTVARRLTYTIICLMVSITWIYVGLFHETQLLLLFLNRCFHGSNDIIVTGSIMSNYAKVGLSSMVFSMVNTVGNLSVVPSSTFIGYLLDYTGRSRQGWTWIFTALGVSQLLALLTFVTFIRSDPVEFRRKNNEKHENEERCEHYAGDTSENETTPANTLEVVVKKEQKGVLNNFEKLKQVEGTESNQVI